MRLAFAAALLAAALFTTEAVAAEPPASCERGDALLAADYLDDAAATYKAVLPDTCTVDGKTGTDRVADARTARFDSLVATVRRLEGEGFDDEARKQAQAIVEEFKRPLPDDVRSLGQRLPWWRQWLGTLVPVARTLLEMLAVGLGLFVLAVVLIRAIGNLVTRSKSSLRLSGFAGDGVDKDELTAALHDRLSVLESESAQPSPRWISATEGDFQIPTAVVSALPQGQLLVGLAQILDRLLWRKVHVIGGTVRAEEPARGAGLTLTISKRSGAQQAEVTVWEKEFGITPGKDEGTASRYARLVRIAAIWLAYQPQAGGEKARLGTSDWCSYALFAVAEEQQRADNNGVARIGYARALDRDAGNLGAKLNFAALTLLHPVTEADDATRWTLSELLLADVIAGEPGYTPLRFRARYLQAVSFLYRGSYKRALSVAEETDRELQHAPCTRFFHTFAETNRVLTETVRMVNGRTSDVSKLDKTWITATTLYNLSCYYARKYARDKQPDDRKDALDRLGQYLARHDGEALERARRYAQNDPAFAPFATDPAFTSKVSPVPAPVVSAPPGPPGAVVVRASLDWGVGIGN